ncbi:MAG: citrate lyase acyl carrier protein [Bacillota bacterium]|nr:citrate lyase acyl carrier protein [Bacillota bacterium]
MQLKKPAVVGTLESCDVQITLFPNPGKGVEINLDSIVKVMFEKSILQTVREELEKFQISDAIVQINDKGAFDWVIRARMQAAICRSAEVAFDWKGVS